MQTTRRNFLKYSSILGLMTLSSFSLFAEEPTLMVESIGSTHMDDLFDPDEWL